MKIRPLTQSGLTFVEVSVTSVLTGVVGLVIFSLLNIGTILGAKNTAVNTAHQQARVAMMQMIQDLHSAISLPYLVDANANPVSAGPAAGIAFQQWASGPHQIIADVTRGENVIQIQRTSGQPAPLRGQRLIVSTHQIEDDITAVNNLGSGVFNLTLAHDIGDTDKDGDLDGRDSAANPNASDPPLAIQGVSTYHIVCFTADRCWYTVDSVNKTLKWHRQGTRVMVNDITNPTPFNTPNTPAGALYYRFVAAIDLSTSDLDYNNRGFKSANILLNGQVPMRTRLTAYQ